MSGYRISERWIKFYALEFLRGEQIPLFAMKADNWRVDQKVKEILAARTKRIKKNRSSGTFYRGGDDR